MTEYFAFLARLYERIVPDATIRVRVKLTKCNDRELVSLDARIPWFDEGYISHEDTISQERDIQVADLRASYLEIARDEVKHIFHVFNWLDVPDSTIDHWQQRLLKREF